MLYMLHGYFGLYIELDQQTKKSFNNVWEISLDYYEDQEFDAT